MNKIYQQIIEARKRGARTISEYGFKGAQFDIACAVKREATYILAGFENELNDEGDYACEVPTAKTLARWVYQNFMTGQFECVEVQFLLEPKHVRFLTKEFLEGLCQWYAEYAWKGFDDWGRKYKTY